MPRPTTRSPSSCSDAGDRSGAGPGNGTPAGHFVWLSVLWSLGTLVVFTALATWQYRRVA